MVWLLESNKKNLKPGAEETTTHQARNERALEGSQSHYQSESLPFCYSVQVQLRNTHACIFALHSPRNPIHTLHSQLTLYKMGTIFKNF